MGEIGYGPEFVIQNNDGDTIRVQIKKTYSIKKLKTLMMENALIAVDKQCYVCTDKTTFSDDFIEDDTADPTFHNEDATTMLATSVDIPANVKTNNSCCHDLVTKSQNEDTYITFRKKDGKDFMIFVKESDTIESMMHRIQDNSGIPLSQQEFVCFDVRTLSDQFWEEEYKRFKASVQAVSNDIKQIRDIIDGIPFQISVCDFDYGDENEVPDIPTEECVSSGEEFDSNENEVSVTMQASAGSTSNQSNIINVKNYRLGAEYYGGKWVKHLYIFNTDTDFCYNYTFQPNKKNYFVCFKCKKINKKRTVSATIASNENGEKYVQLNENEHVCERQKFELKTIIYEPDFKLDTVKVRGKEIQHLFVSDSNDKTLYYIYTLISGAKSYRCNNCQNIHNIHVRAYLLIDENGKQCCVLNAQKHKCRPQKL